MAEWISVKDRLPDEGELVLVVEEGQVIIAEYEVSSNTFFESCYGAAFMVDSIVRNPTHWMRVPEPPGGE